MYDMISLWELCIVSDNEMIDDIDSNANLVCLNHSSRNERGWSAHVKMDKRERRIKLSVRSAVVS